MTLYQLVASGQRKSFGGSPHSIASKKIYTAMPGDTEKDDFRKKCIDRNRATSLDPDGVNISVLSLELVDNGDLLVIR